MNTLKHFFIFSLCFLPVFLTAQNDTCNYRIQLIDFFGDGWDGAELIVVTSADTNRYTLPDSTIRFVDIPAIQNETLQIFFSSGAFDEEISYIVFDPMGEIIFNDGPFPDTGLVVDIIACPSCPVPTDITISTKDKESFLQWNKVDQVKRYLIEYGIKGFSLGEGELLSTTDTFITIPDLLPFTEYDVFVSSLCEVSSFPPPVEIEFSLMNLFTNFTTRYAKDVGITSITMPNSGCGLSDSEMITIGLKNFGANPQSLIPFRFSVNGMDGGVMIPSDGFYTNVLSKDSIAFIEFETTYDFSQAGTYEVAVWTELEGDSQIANDTAYLLVQSIPTISELPYSQDFEIADSDWFTIDETAEMTWQLGNTNVARVHSFYGGTNSWLLEITKAMDASEQTYLYSPCLDFSTYEDDLKIAFQLQVNTIESTSSCWVEMSIDEGENWQRIDSIDTSVNWYNNATYTAWTNATDVGLWRYVETPLPNSARQATVQLRIVFANGENEPVGRKITVDDIQLFPQNTTNLVALRTNNTASVGCGLIDDEVQIWLYNAGGTPVLDFSFNYQINDGEVVTENRNGLFDIASGFHTAYTFQTPFDASISGIYTIKTWVKIADEEIPISDTAYYQFIVDAPLPLPLVEDFEDQEVDEGWFAVGNAEVAIRPPGDHNNESNIVAVNLWSGATRTAIHTANYGRIVEGDSLSFDYRFVLWDDSTLPLNMEGDSLIIEISNDCGATFEPLLVIDENNHLPLTEFQTVKLDLAPYVGQNAVFRFRALWAQNDYWLDMDNITILPGEMTTSVIDEPELIQSLQLFPNPTTGQVQLELSLQEVVPISLQILNMTGQILLESEYPHSNQFNEILDLQDYQNGVYLIKIRAGQQSIHRKLIKVD